jgi:hypothetical protein
MPVIVELSVAAVAVLRFRVRRYKMPVSERSLAAFHELIDAGIMEPVPGPVSEFRFTERAWPRRHEILAASEDHLLSLIPPLPERIELSAAARAVLRCHMSGDREVTDANRPAYRELAGVGIMMSVGTFSKGDDCVFRFTHRGWERRFEFAEMTYTQESA